MNHEFNAPVNDNDLAEVNYENLNVGKYYYLKHHVFGFVQVKVIEKNDQFINVEFMNGEQSILTRDLIQSNNDIFYTLHFDYIAQGQQGGRKKKYHKKSKKTHKKSKKSKRRKTGKHKK